MKYIEYGLISKHYDYCNAVMFKDVPNGTFFIKSLKSKTVYIKQLGDYDRNDKKYYCSDYNNINKYTTVKPDSIVYIGFTY